MSEMSVPITLSVIVPTLNDRLISDVVQRIQYELGCLDESRYLSEIIVVGKDEPGRLTVITGLKFIDTGRKVGASESRNLGIEATKGEWLLFVDADCLVQPGWAIAMTERLASGASVVGGGVTFPTDAYWPLVYNLSMFHEFLTERQACEMRYLPTLNLAVKRTVIDVVGLMDVSMKRGQDIDWTVRMTLAGFSLFFEPAAVISHHPVRADFRTVWRYWVRSGYYSSRNRQKYRDHYQTPRILSNRWLVRLLSPLVATYITARIFLKTPRLLRFAATAPAIFMTKVAWCLGASMDKEPVA